MQWYGEPWYGRPPRLPPLVPRVTALLSEKPSWVLCLLTADILIIFLRILLLVFMVLVLFLLVLLLFFVMLLIVLPLRLVLAGAGADRHVEHLTASCACVPSAIS